MNNTITILNVGHGNCTIINMNNHICIIDTGESTELLEYLEKKEVKIIDYLFLSHADKDHIGKALALLTNNNLEIKKICLNPDLSKDTMLWGDLASEIDIRHNKGSIEDDFGVVSNRVFDFQELKIYTNSPSPEINLLGPNKYTKQGELITSNSKSLFLTIMKDDTSIIALPSDIDQTAYNHIPDEKKTLLKSKYFVFPHHGGLCRDISFYNSLLQDVNPEYVIISNGQKKYNNPKKEVINIIKQHNAAIKIMCTSLSTNCQCCDSYESCADSIIIDINTKKIIEPNLTQYDIKLKTITSRLCK